MTSIRDFSDFDLAAELTRRAYAKRDQEPPFLACDECRHFQWLKVGQDVPNDYNPCALGHHTSFRMPISESDYEWGFYRRRCSDRDPTRAEIVAGTCPKEGK